MRLAAVALSALALAGGSAQTRLLAFDYDARQLAYFDPATLVRSQKSIGYNASLCSWSYSPDRRHVAVSDCQGTMRFLGVPSLRGEGRMTWSSMLGNASAVTWLRADRLVAVSTIGTDLSRLVLIDPTRRRILARTDLDGLAAGRAVVRGSAVLLVVPSGRFGPPRVLVAGPGGGTRTIAVGRFSTGTVSSTGTDGVLHFEARTPGFAVDSAGGRAFVVGQDLTVAEVDLASGSVAYHGPVRTLAKTFDGWTRSARWLGNGRIAVSGLDQNTSGDSITTTPLGLRVVDTGTWSARMVDQRATSFLAAGRTLFANHDGWSAYREDGTHLYDVQLDGRDWLSIQGGRGYVCDQRTAVALLDPATGARSTAVKGRPCPTFVVVPRSEN